MILVTTLLLRQTITLPSGTTRTNMMDLAQSVLDLMLQEITELKQQRKVLVTALEGCLFHARRNGELSVSVVAEEAIDSVKGQR